MNHLHINILRVINNTRTFGFKNTCRKLAKYLHLTKGHADYGKWRRRQLLVPAQREEQRRTVFSYRPEFSILVPLFESDERYLRELIASVQAQTYDNWELCFSDGSADPARLQGILKPYMDSDARIRYVAAAAGPLGISENTNQAYTIAGGDYIVLGDHDDLFAEDALFECAKALNDQRVSVIYTDEDKVDETGRRFFSPNFKPDFNIDLLRCNNYICHMFVAARSLVEKAGLFDPAYDGAQDYDFILRCIERADGITHIPKVLYHWRAHAQSTALAAGAKDYAFAAGRRAIEAHLVRMGLSGTVTDGAAPGYYKISYPVHGNPLISIIIPNKDHVSYLKRCLESFDRLAAYRNYEFIIVENNSVEPETFAYYEELAARDNVDVLRWKEPFNYSAINNFGVAHAHGEYLLLLNNDTELIDGSLLEEMLGYCQRADVGIVGARLYYEDDTIQHAGVIVGIGGIAGHAFSGQREEDGIYQLRTQVSCDYSAVTAACLMIRKDVYEEVGGLEPEFQVAFNDVDFCLKVRRTGRLVVYVPQARMHHYESKSRGAEDTIRKQNRFHQEMQLFLKRWPDILREGDPYYNPNLTLVHMDFSLKE